MNSWWYVLIVAAVLCFYFAARALLRRIRYQRVSGTALVTGASGAVGKWLVSFLVERCDKIVVNGRNLQRLEELEREYGERIIPFVYDFSEFTEEDFREAYSDLARNYAITRIDHVFLNAGSGYYGMVTREPNIQSYLAANVVAPACLIHLFKDSETITLTGSCMGHCPAPNYALYSLSKEFQAGLAFCTRNHGKHILKVQVICPATIRDSEFFDTPGMKGSRQGIRALGKCKIFNVSPRNVAVSALKAAEFNISKLNVGWVSFGMQFMGCCRAIYEFFF